MNELINRCARVGTTKLKDFVAALRQDVAYAGWSRARVISELVRLGYQVAEDKAGVAHVVGLTLPVAYTVQDGRIVKS